MDAYLSVDDGLRTVRVMPAFVVDDYVTYYSVTSGSAFPRSRVSVTSYACGLRRLIRSLTYLDVVGPFPDGTVCDCTDARVISSIVALLL